MCQRRIRRGLQAVPEAAEDAVPEAADEAAEAGRIPAAAADFNSELWDGIVG